MSKLAWQKTNQKLRPSRTIVDDEEYRSRDAAARWLEKRAKAKPAKRKPAASQENAA